MVGTPIGQTSTQSPRTATSLTGQQTGSALPPKTTVSTPIDKPVVGIPRPMVGTPVATQASPQPDTPATSRPTVSTPKPSAQKLPENKAEISRRNFIKALAVVGGIVAVGQFVALGPYLQGSVGQTNTPATQTIQDAKTGTTLTTGTSIISTPNSWTTFVYPRTGNPNIDNDTFRQCVLIHLPKGWSAGSLGAVDPNSGDSFVALSRVCVHLWCLWSYIPSDDLGICPCHGSQYIPGGPAGSAHASQPGLAVGGPASLQTPPNNQLPLIKLSIAKDGTISATGIVGQIGCGQYC